MGPRHSSGTLPVYEVCASPSPRLRIAMETTIIMVLGVATMERRPTVCQVRESGVMTSREKKEAEHTLEWG